MLDNLLVFIYKFLTNVICSGIVVFEVSFQIVWEEKHLQYNEHDEKFDENNKP
jgi:hypothetical protein